MDSVSTPMAKFYLHVRRGNTIWEDRHGVDVDGADGAVEKARQYGREILRDEPEMSAQLQWIEIEDEAGAIVRKVPFGFL